MHDQFIQIKIEKTDSVRLVEKTVWEDPDKCCICYLDRQQLTHSTGYVEKHCERIPDYVLYQALGICIRSGNVESKIKQIGARLKITGAQWNDQNVSQILKLRCAYLNRAIAQAFILIV